ncbi:MAG: ABC transporter ATP-binding protein [Halanaerobiales bacterium]|nr:ABC transporter ATP-binding protein [Halanaerobiales bacterium]
MNNLLEVKNLSKKYQEFSLQEISFTLKKGYIMGFIGPNGAGKSTTIKLIMNLLKRDGGEIRVFGLDNIRAEREIKDRIGFVYEEPYFYEELTVLEMKKVIAPFYSKWDDQIFDQYLKRFGLSVKKKIKELSKGMKMKVWLAIALSHQAELLILDEPTSGLDPVVRRELLDILADVIQDEEKGVFFSTHITTDLDKIADYITFINNGEIIFSTTKDYIMDNYGLVKGKKAGLDNTLLKEAVGLRENKFGFEALVKDRNRFWKGSKGEFIIEKPTLEEIILYYTRGKQG